MDILDQLRASKNIPAKPDILDVLRSKSDSTQPSNGKQYDHMYQDFPEAVNRASGDMSIRPPITPGRYYGAEQKKAQEFANYQPSPIDAPLGSPKIQGGEYGTGEATTSQLRDASWYRDPQNQIKALSESMQIPADQFEVTPHGIAYNQDGKKYLVDTGMKVNSFVADQTGGSLPANIGGAVGGLVGGVEGAAVGMGAGEAYRQRVANNDMGEAYNPKAVLDTVVTAEMVGKPLSMITQMGSSARTGTTVGDSTAIDGYGKNSNGLSPLDASQGNARIAEIEARRSFQESQGVKPTADTLTDNPSIRNFGDAVPSSVREGNQAALESKASELQNSFDTGLTDKAKAAQKGAREFVANVQKESSKRYEPVKKELDNTIGYIAPPDLVYTLRSEIPGVSGKAGERIKSLVEDGIKETFSVSGKNGVKGWKFSELQSLKSDFGDLAYAAKTGQEGLTSKDVAPIKRVASMIKAEMDKIVDAQPNKKLAEAWRTAEDYHKNVYVPAKNSKLMNNLRAMETPDQAINSLMPASKAPSVHRSQILYKNMTPEGQKNTASMMVDNLIESARTARGELDPKVLADNAMKWKSSLDIFIGNSEAVKSFVKLARQMESQSRYLAKKNEGINPDLHATSAKNAILYHAGSSAPGAVAGAGIGYTLGGPVGAVAGGAAGWAMNRQVMRYLFLNKSGQNMLLKFTNSSMNERQALMPIIQREAQKAYPEPYESDAQPSGGNINGGSGAFQNGIPEPVGRNKYEHHPRLVPEPDMNALRDAFNKKQQAERAAWEAEQAAKSSQKRMPSNIVDSTFEPQRQIGADNKPRLTQQQEPDIIDSTWTPPRALPGPNRPKLTGHKGEGLPKPGKETGAEQWDINGKRVQGQGTADYEWMKRNKPVKNWPPKDEARPKSATQHPGSEDFENTQPVEVRLNDSGKMSLISPIPDKPGKWKVDVVDDASKTSYGRMKKDGSIGEPKDKETIYHSRGEAVRAAHQNGYKKRFDDFKRAVKAQELIAKKSKKAISNTKK